MNPKQRAHAAAKKHRKPPRPYKIGDEKFTIRTLSGAERDQLESGRTKTIFEEDRKRGLRPVDVKLNANNYRARHVVVFLGDGDGQRIFADSDVAEVGREWDGQLLDEIFTAGLQHNGMDDGSVEEAEKNSASTGSSASGSTSPATNAAPSKSSDNA